MPLGVIRDIAIEEEAPGNFVILVSGNGGMVARIRDNGNGGGTAGDCVFDEESFLSDSRVREGTDIVDAGDLPPLLWDQLGQRAFRFHFDANHEIDGLASSVAIRVPVGREASALVHSVEYPMAFATGGNPDHEARVMRFEDTGGTGVYSLVGEGAPQTVGPYPPNFPLAPAAGQASVWVSGRLGTTVTVFPVDAAGATTGSSLGAAAVPVSGVALVALSRSLVGGERIRPIESVSGLAGFYPVVTPTARPRGFLVSPVTGPAAGGTVVTLRGSGMTGATQVRVGGVLGTALSVVDDRTLRFTTPASVEPAGAIEVTTPIATSVVGSFRYESQIVSATAESALATWTRTGSGWACSSTAIDANEAPPSGHRGGCQYVGSVGTNGTLTSTGITLPAQGGPFGIRLVHRGSFGTDGDGVVVLAYVGGAGYALSPRDEGTSRVHAPNCTGSGTTTTCVADTAVAGAPGLARGAMSGEWRTSTFDLPSAFTAGGTLSLQFVAQNYSSLAASRYQLARVEVVKLEAGVGDRVESGWTTLSQFDASCSGVTLVAPFTCAASYSGATGAALRYFNAPSGSVGEARIPVSFAGLGGRTISLVVRHRVDFTAGTTVGSGYGRVRVCCGSSCGTEAPLDGYPPSPALTASAYTDQGPDGGGWSTEEWNLTAYAGLTSTCTLRFFGQGIVASTQPGWLIDSAVVRWR